MSHQDIEKVSRRERSEARRSKAVARSRARRAEKTKLTGDVKYARSTSGSRSGSHSASSLRSELRSASQERRQAKAARKAEAARAPKAAKPLKAAGPARKINWKRLIGVIVICVLVICAAVGGRTAWQYSKAYQHGGTITDSDSPLVQTAREELGNVGGEKFWEWYGYTWKVDWCGCFVSWCADQNGYLEAGTVPKFAYVQEGLNWYKQTDMWRDPGYEPHGGEIIFFDWNANDIADHVGIVSGCKFDRVYTIEGNRKNDTCSRGGYKINSKYIMGYGLPEGEPKE